MLGTFDRGFNEHNTYIVFSLIQSKNINHGIGSGYIYTPSQSIVFNTGLIRRIHLPI